MISNTTLTGPDLKSGRDEHKVCKMYAPNLQGHWSPVSEPNDRPNQVHLQNVIWVHPELRFSH